MDSGSGNVNIANLIPGLLLVVVACIELGLFFYFLRYEKTHSIRAYLVFIFGVVIWVASNGIGLLKGNGDVTVFVKTAYLGGTILATGFLYFIHTFPYPVSKRSLQLRHIVWVSTLLFVYFMFFTGRFVGAVVLENGIMKSISVGVFLWLWVLHFLVVWSFAVAELVRRFLRSTGIERMRFRYLLIGVVISLAIGVITDVIFPVIPIFHYAWLGSLFSIVWLWFSVRAIRIS